jgi:hypothetical protein
MKWMETTSMRLPDEHEAIEGAGVAAATAVGLLSRAGNVADAGNYGIARSLAVLALEESVKARTLGPSSRRRHRAVAQASAMAGDMDPALLHPLGGTGCGRASRMDWG